MRVVTFKTTRKSIFFTLLGITAAFALVVTLIGSFAGRETSGKGESVAAASNSQRVAFLTQYGWTVTEEPVEVREIVIPETFGDVYNNYNKIQLEQGFDLTAYQGKSVKRYTYMVTNYPGYEEKECILANLLVDGDNVIGGDICSTELDGFMHTFKSKQS